MTEEKNDINNLFLFPVENEIVVIILFFFLSHLMNCCIQETNTLWFCSELQDLGFFVERTH